MTARIGLFGGTFDPVHRGHISIAESFLNSGLIDELWVLLTPYPPHKQKAHQTPYKLRLDMLKAAFKGKEKIVISTIENELPKPSYSVQTIRHFKELHPDALFYFCMGEDSLRHFHTWKKYREILDECELMVAQRPGETHDQVRDEILRKAHMVEHEPLDIASSEIRKGFKEGKNVSAKLPKSVLKIIEKEQLYS
ncbi:nicotinate (nicotinamide) nucleotide adenylyltransferase [Gracilimonas tropica]|uniref:nicotinate (nicotinamide) nucleotide adenylyltransferase n=1 Tax=Gracilimonas tropica TaxID=454600 RepID=UPI00036D1AC0|nr:nicotinate (nicotinamide) nucleotide adenylyltransferase [Gracilimonas tropica]